METIDINEVFAQANVVENLKNFAGIDAQNALGMMSPERLAAVVGGKQTKIGNLFIGNVNANTYSGMIEFAKVVISQIPTDGKCTSFYSLANGDGKRLVRGFLYEDKSYGIIEVVNYTGVINRISIEEGVISEIN